MDFETARQNVARYMRFLSPHGCNRAEIAELFSLTHEEVFTIFGAAPTVAEAQSHRQDHRERGLAFSIGLGPGATNNTYRLRNVSKWLAHVYKIHAIDPDLNPYEALEAAYTLGILEGM